MEVQLDQDRGVVVIWPFDIESCRILAQQAQDEQAAYDEQDEDRRADFSPRGRSSAHPAAHGDTRAAPTPSWPDGPPLPTVRPDGTPPR